MSDSDSVFTLPTAPAGPWDQLTPNEQAWVEFIRVISCGSDPSCVFRVKLCTDFA